MSTRRPSKCASRRVFPGFTLIELLVVVAIIAVLLSILLPSLRGARDQTRAVVCGQRIGDLGRGMHTYFTENSDWIPGVNTSGFQVNYLLGDKGWWETPRIPVQTYDWITPLMAPNLTMPQNRAKRFRDLINHFHCPSQKLYRAVVYSAGQQKCPDKKDFDEEPNGWIPLSYLMPVQFQFWGTDYAEGSSSQFVLGYNKNNPRQAIYAATAPRGHGWEADHRTYKSRLNLVGNPALKVMASDGTRYLAADMLDFDPDPAPGLFGSFTGGGAWWAGDTAYGIRSGTKNFNGRSIGRGSPSDGRNMELSYRHGSKRGVASGSALDNVAEINAGFFDGSVRRLSDRQSRNPVLWYPRGTVVNDNSECMLDDLVTGDIIP